MLTFQAPNMEKCAPMWHNLSMNGLRSSVFLPIYKLVNGIRVKIMEMNARRHLEAESWTHTFVQ